jgi:hypothetical protein
MRCKSCGSENLQNLVGEIAIHFPGMKNIDKPVVWVRPELVVCFECGIAQFAVPEAELRKLRKRDPDVPKTPCRSRKRSKGGDESPRDPSACPSQ